MKVRKNTQFHFPISLSGQGPKTGGGGGLGGKQYNKLGLAAYQGARSKNFQVRNWVNFNGYSNFNQPGLYNIEIFLDNLDLCLTGSVRWFKTNCLETEYGSTQTHNS